MSGQDDVETQGNEGTSASKVIPGEVDYGVDFTTPDSAHNLALWGVGNATEAESWHSFHCFFTDPCMCIAAAAVTYVLVSSNRKVVGT
jgi:hypothetical protein